MTPFEIIRRLTEAKIHFTLATYREGAIMIAASVPGERWEIEAFDDGRIEIEIFRSSGDISGTAALDDLITRFAD